MYCIFLYQYPHFNDDVISYLVFLWLISQARQKAIEEAKLKLKMPPVLPERKPINDILSQDKFLAGMETAKYIFTDITFQTPHRVSFESRFH